MHTRHGTGQHKRTTASLPPRIRPGCAEDEEQSQRHDASGNRDDGRTDDVGHSVDAVIVGDGIFAQVMHPADGGTGEDAAGRYSPPGNDVVDSDGEEGPEQHDDGDEEGHGCEAAGVGNLQLGLAAGYLDGSVANEVLLMSVDGYSERHTKSKASDFPHTMHQMAIPPIEMAEVTNSRLGRR